MVGRNILEHPNVSEFEVLAPQSNELNLFKFKAIKTYLRKHQPDMIIHAAGKVGGIQANMLEPISFFVDNFDMGRNIIMAAHEIGIKSMINLGSSCMYPCNYSDSLTEEMLLKGALEPTNEGYALAKIASAKLCEYITREDSAYQYKTIIPCNLYGRYDKYNPKNSHLLAAIIHKIHQAKIKNNPVVEIWGDGNARREFMYSGDLADAILVAIKNFKTLPIYMNIGLGYDHTINEYYEAVTNIIGYQGKLFNNISSPVGTSRKLVNIDRQIAWGWQAKTNLIDGIKEAYKFYLRECAHDF